MNTLKKIKYILHNHLVKKNVLKQNPDDYLLPQYRKKEYSLLRKKGFSETDYILFELAKNDYKDYLNEFDRAVLRKINGKYAIVLDDKELTYKIFGKYIAHPEIIFTVKDHIFYNKDGFEIEISQFLEELKNNQGLFYNGTGSGGGKNAFSIKFNQNDLIVDCQKKPVSFLEELSDGCFSKIFIQSEETGSFYPGSVNTIRCVTINDNGKISVISGAHRFGTSTSKSKDNLCSGGIAAQIDIETGILGIGKSAFCPDKYTFHPYSNKKIFGYKVPNWENIKKAAISLHGKARYLKFIAWDFAISFDNQIFLIEANASSSVSLLQLEKGVKNEPLGQFLKKNGCIFNEKNHF